MIKPKIVPITIPAIAPFVKWWNDKDDDELPLSDSTDGFNDDGAILASVGINVGSTDGSNGGTKGGGTNGGGIGLKDGRREGSSWVNVGSEVIGSNAGSNDTVGVLVEGS